MAKRVPERTVVCTNCRTQVVAAPRYTLLGLFRFACPRCGETFVYPMSDRRRKWYRVIAVLFAVLFAVLVAFGGRIALPGILPVGAVVALVQDAAARKKVAATEASASMAGLAPARPDR